MRVFRGWNWLTVRTQRRQRRQRQEQGELAKGASFAEDENTAMQCKIITLTASYIHYLTDKRLARASLKMRLASLGAVLFRPFQRQP